MSRSKLELYADILEVLVNNGPLKVTWISLRARVNYALMKPMLGHLVAKALVEEKRLKDGSVGFCATELGRESLKQFKSFCSFNPIVFSEKSVNRNCVLT
jgi:predicted transcriptional regulator